MAYQRLSAQDASFLEIEQPGTPMHVGGCFLFEGGELRRSEGGIDVDAVRDYVESRLHRIPRYRQRIERIPVEGHPIWVDDDRFNIQYHVRHTALPAPGDERQLKRLCGRILSQRLDPARPLWEMWVVEGLQEERFALVTKVHHCMIDGLSGVDLLQVLLSVKPEKQIEIAPGFYPGPTPTRGRLLRDAIVRRAFQPLDLAIGAVRSLRDPDGLRARAEEVVQGLVSNLSVGLRATSETPFNEPVGPHRRFDWVAFDLDEVKRIKNALGGTVNDVVLATVTGAVARFLEMRGVSFRNQPSFEFRVACPVSVRSAEERGTLGNRVASMVVSLPVSEPDPARRLARIRETTADVKASKQAIGAEILASVSEWTAPTLMTMGMRLAFGTRTVNMVVTNVPGPQLPLYLLGARMVAAYPMAPLFSSLGLNVALFSYAGGLYWGLNGDWDGLPDLHEFALGLDLAFAELGAAADAASTDD